MPSGTVVSASKKEGGGDMFFMAIFSWEPEKRDEVLKRRATEKIPEGMELVDEWVCISGNRVFRLFKASKPEVILMTSFFWNDIGEVELIPVMRAEEVLRAFQQA